VLSDAWGLTAALTAMPAFGLLAALLRKFQEAYGVAVLHAWGMTELSPIGTVGAVKAKHHEMCPEERYVVQAKQRRAVFGVDMKIVGADGIELPWDGATSGDLLVRGP
jgi:acyl-CoA synthetase (AMP-forming)/AMP-acid ligase II